MNNTLIPNTLTQTEKMQNSQFIEFAEQDPIDISEGSIDHVKFNFLGKNLGKKVNLYLINGVKLVGFISGFDNSCVLISDVSRNEQLVMIAAISTISPIPV